MEEPGERQGGGRRMCVRPETWEGRKRRGEKKGNLRLVVVNSTEPKAPKEREEMQEPTDRLGGSAGEKAGEEPGKETKQEK